MSEDIMSIPNQTILELLNDLSQVRNDLAQLKHAQEPRAHIFNELEISSYHTHEINTALAKTQAEMKPAGLNNANPFFKSRYADLAEIVRVSRPLLTKNQLSVTQHIMTNTDGQKYLHTRVSHASGQWLCSNLPLVPVKNDVQALGSTISYAKRYAYSSLVGVVTTDEDDDGEAAVRDQRPMPTKPYMSPPFNHTVQSSVSDRIVPEQLDQLKDLLDGDHVLEKKITDGLKISSLAQMPKHTFLKSLQRIREIKATEK